MLSEQASATTFWQGLKATYTGSVAFLVAHPLLALVPVVFEIAQHVVEVRIGLYASIAAAKALEHDPWRMGFGFLKLVALMVPGYWIARFLAWHDAELTRRADSCSMMLFGGYLAFGIVTAAVQLFVLPQTGSALLASLLAGQVIGCLLAGWGAAAALGNPMIGPFESIRIMARQLPWTFGFLLAAMLPLMIPHYVLGALALIGPRPLLWPALIVDALLVGWLTAVLVASAFVAAIRAAARADVPLVPPLPAYSL
ncbi:hypothetical protein [uncultured Sphingomonas sp.]|uniref:hypothetical protein n=1 Tax=uncultured Sphingomonas sp. TaxID=158754 RepID=UPI0035C986F4